MHGSRGVVGSSRSALRLGLVAAQVALATMLLVGGALLLQSFVRLHRVPLATVPYRGTPFTGRIAGCPVDIQVLGATSWY